MARLHRFLFIWALGALLAPAMSCDDVDVYPSTSRSLPPDAVEDAVLAYDSTARDAVLTWTAPQPRGGTRGIARYDIRMAYGDTLRWESAEAVPDPPRPAAPGEVQSYRFRYPRRGADLKASVRSLDASGNFSGPGNVAALRIPGHTLTGRVRDVFSGQPVAGVAVLLNGFENDRTTATRNDGSWVLEDVAPGPAVLQVGAGGAAPEYFPVVIDLLISSDNSEFSHDMVPFEMSTVLPSLSLLGLFREALGVRTGDPVLRKWTSLPLAVHVQEYTSPGGIDYRAAAESAMERWTDLTGVALFQTVSAAPDTGVTLSFLTPEQMGGHTGVTSHVNTSDGHPLRSDVRIVNTIENPVVLRRVLLHELGHALRLRHLPAGFLMYGGQPLPDDPTADEVWLVRLLAAMPDLTDTSVYSEVSR